MHCIGIDGQNVTIVTDPAGIRRNGQPGTFFYPILTSVTLMCLATASDGSPVTVTSYKWNAIACYSHPHTNYRCFFGNNPTGQNITGNNLLARDHGTVTCTAIINGMNYTSDPLRLLISGKQKQIVFIVAQ